MKTRSSDNGDDDIHERTRNSDESAMETEKSVDVHIVACTHLTSGVSGESGAESDWVCDGVKIVHNVYRARHSPTRTRRRTA